MSVELQSDVELVAAARSGDKNAFGELIERHRPMAVRVATGVVAHPEIARELAQETLLQAYLSLGNLRDANRFQSWLYGIVLNVCRRDRKTDSFSLEQLTGGLRVEDLPLVDDDPGSGGAGRGAGAAWRPSRRCGVGCRAGRI